MKARFLLFPATVALLFRSLRFQRRIDRAIPPGDRFETIDGARIELDDRGHGPSILLIHGLAGQMRNFTGELAGLLATDHRVVCYDRPGAGHSVRRHDRDATLANEARIAAELIERLQLGRTIVLGHSLGGAIALQLALDHPGRVAALALVSPLTAVTKRPKPALWMFAIPHPLPRLLFAWTLAVPLGLRLAAWRLQQLFGPDPVHPEFRTRFGGMLTARPSAYRGASADLMAARSGMPALVARYGQLACPVAILYGRGDRILDPVRNGDEAARLLPNATLERVEGGHMLPITFPPRVARFVRDVAARAA